MRGGAAVGFARAATASSQADKLVDAYLDGDVASKAVMRDYHKVRQIESRFELRSNCEIAS